MPNLAGWFTLPLNRPYTSLFPSTLVIPNITFAGTITSTTTTTIKPSTLTMFCSSSSLPSPSVSNTKEDSEQQKLLLAQVLKYHNQTKHSFTSYARGPHGLDWANQPNPFRRFNSAPLFPLLHLPEHDENADGNHLPPPLYSSLFLSLPPPKPITISTISKLFYESLALSAWKTTGFSTWSLRVNPSSGNLHPTEAYIIAPPIDSISNSPFAAHYAPKEHSLELRTTIPSGFFPKFFPKGSFLIGITSIFWREAWKYGERAFRYCNHDVGHAIAAVSIAAAELGWDVKILDGLGCKDLEKLMGLEIYPDFKIPSRAVKGKFPDIEFEHPDCVLAVFPNGVGEFDVNYEELSYAISKFSELEWCGKPNLLSKEHVCWDVIYKTAEAVKKPWSIRDKFSIDPFVSSKLFSEGSHEGLTVREVVRKRRSAVDMDGIHVMERDTFYQILLHCLPSGLPKGLYFLVRNEDHLDDLKKGTKSDFRWEKPEGCPADLPLYELAKGDYQKLAKRVSCHQDIAGDGCFSLGMVAHFEPTLRDKGVWMYPRLFWETGVLGQLLYLEAHAVGISATGIGCYFDDAVHELLGFRGSNFQSLYHFTVGGPVLDKRIMSLPAYPGPGVDA